MFNTVHNRVIWFSLISMLVGLSGCAGKPISVPEVSQSVKSGQAVDYTTAFKASRYEWIQLSGVRVRLIAPKSATLSFTAPMINEESTLVFSLKTIKSGAWKIPHTTEKVRVTVSPK